MVMSEARVKRPTTGYTIHVIASLPSEWQDYATEYWHHLSQGTRPPDHREFGLSDSDAQEVRIKLAGLV